MPRGFKDWCERNDVIMPENSFQLRQVGFGEVRAGVHGAIVDTADFERQRIGLRRDKKICTETAKFFCQPVPYIERYAQRRGGHAHAESQRRAGEKLVARASSKGIGNKSQEHEVRGSPCRSTINRWCPTEESPSQLALMTKYRQSDRYHPCASEHRSDCNHRDLPPMAHRSQSRSADK